MVGTCLCGCELFCKCNTGSFQIIVALESLCLARVDGVVYGNKTREGLIER